MLLAPKSSPPVFSPCHRRHVAPKVRTTSSRVPGIFAQEANKVPELNFVVFLMLFFCHSDHSDFCHVVVFLTGVFPHITVWGSCFSDWCFFCLGFDHSDAFHGQKM